MIDEVALQEALTTELQVDTLLGGLDIDKLVDYFKDNQLAHIIDNCIPPLKLSRTKEIN